MNEHDLQRILRGAGRGARETQPDPGLAETVLARLPRVRFVRPGSDPGGRTLLLAGLLGIGAAAAVAGLMSNATPPGSKPAMPPAWTLFQAGEPVCPRPAAGFP